MQIGDGLKRNHNIMVKPCSRAHVTSILGPSVLVVSSSPKLFQCRRQDSNLARVTYKPRYLPCGILVSMAVLLSADV
ncbi:unnamed protein product [Protopolystoma xenopodis]|uniref:Uncharacterized protein n=1 Tax=Protopolystoma xenopodis TaxID=117903 RepID=A0A448XBC3_9PLAT|nr:unnamed protein product [Protopolystoma xenopodis]